MILALFTSCAKKSYIRVDYNKKGWETTWPQIAHKMYKDSVPDINAIKDMINNGEVNLVIKGVAWAQFDVLLRDKIRDLFLDIALSGIETINDKVFEALDRKQISDTKNLLVAEINDMWNLRESNNIANAFYLVKIIYEEESKPFSTLLEHLINKSYDLLISLDLSEESPSLKQDLQTLSKNSINIFMRKIS